MSLYNIKILYLVVVCEWVVYLYSWESTNFSIVKNTVIIAIASVILSDSLNFNDFEMRYDIDICNFILQHYELWLKCEKYEDENELDPGGPPFGLW